MIFAANLLINQADNVTKPTPNFELKLEMNLKEPALTCFVKRLDLIKIYLSKNVLITLVFNGSVLVYDCDHHDHDRDRYIPNKSFCAIFNIK
jgi:hypothetical protein